MPMFRHNSIEVPKLPKLKYVKGVGISQICALDEQNNTYILWWQPCKKVISKYDIGNFIELNLKDIINNNVKESCNRSPEYTFHIEAALEQLANDPI